MSQLEFAALDRLLPCLADGAFHSGEELGQLLGVSRTAVWKQLQKLDVYGLTVDSVKGKGYRLARPLDLLSVEAIRQRLDAEAGAVLSLNYCVCTDSTSSRAMAAAQDDAHGQVFLAEQQSAGRGRRGRAWVSPFAANVYLSLVWRFAGGAAAISGLSLAVGVACARALSHCGLQGVSLKWPNDLLLNQQKLGGILLEMTGDAAGPCQVIVGVGINVDMPPAAVIDQPWTDLASAGLRVRRSELVAQLLNQLVQLLNDFSDRGFGAFRTEWQALDAFRGQPVALIAGTAERRGIARGVDDSGALLLETDQGLQAVHGGELSLRSQR